MEKQIKIVQVCIRDNDIRENERVLETYLLANPDKDKLKELKDKIECRFDYMCNENLSDEEIKEAERFADEIWSEIDKFIKENFVTIDIDSTFEISY